MKGREQRARSAAFGSAAADGVQEITLQTRDDYTFIPDTFTVAPGSARLTLPDVAGEMTHHLEFDDEVPEPGDYPFACTFHLQLGQTGTMTVSG